MRLEYLQSFYQVVQQGGFSAAAEQLEVSKGLVSRHVRRLEMDLDAKLLHRTTRKVSLTEAGGHLYQHAVQIFTLARDAEQVVADLTQEASGILRFTAPITLGERVLPELLGPFHQECPGVRVETHFTAQAFRLEDGEQDIALRAFDHLPDNVVSRLVGRLRSVVVAHPRYLDSQGRPDCPADLHQHQCILFSHMESGRNWRFEQADAVEIVPVSGLSTVNQYSTARRLALTGYGLANIPFYQVEQDVAEGELEIVLPGYQTNMHDLYIIHASHRHLPKKLRVFKEILQRWFTQNPQYLASV